MEPKQQETSVPIVEQSSIDAMVPKIIKYDPSFTESDFKSFVDNVFIQVHLAVMTKEIENVKHFMSEEVYSIFKARVEDLRARGRVQMYDEINVKSTELCNVEIADTHILVSVRLISRYMDYLLDEEGNFISGENSRRIEKINQLTFAKKIESKELGSVRKCPGCRAPIDVNANGLCRYCGSTFDLKDKGWILTKIETRVP